MDHDQRVGLFMWLVVTWPVWSPTLNLIRLRNRVGGATSSTGSTHRTAAHRQTGPKWEQDRPFPECFDNRNDREIGDDL